MAWQAVASLPGPGASHGLVHGGDLVQAGASLHGPGASHGLVHGGDGGLGQAGGSLHGPGASHGLGHGGGLDLLLGLAGLVGAYLP